MLNHGIFTYNIDTNSWQYDIEISIKDNNKYINIELKLS